MKNSNHEELAKLFKGGFVYSLTDWTKYNMGIDKYVLPSVMKDLQMRTSKVKPNGVDLSTVKMDMGKLLKTDFWDYIHGSQDFNSFQTSVCEKMIDILSKRYTPVCYGKAQKAFNMAMKFLYCFDGAIEFEKRFADCHMPLDSKILGWYREKVDKKQKTEWSKLSEEEYFEIQQKIKQHITENYAPYSVLQAEFVIWDREINKKLFK